MECATYPMVEPKRNRRLWTQCGTQYVGQCIGMDTARIQMDNAHEEKREGFETGGHPSPDYS